MAGNTYLHKVYNRTRRTITQRVFDGDFEGLPDQTFLAYWGLNGSPKDVWRNKRDAYPIATPSKGITMDGTSTYLKLAKVGTVAGGGYPDIRYSSFSISTWWYKPSWAVSQTEDLVDHILNPGTSNSQGWGLTANVTTGNLEAKVYIGANAYSSVATPSTATYALSSMAAGWHNIIFGTDGRYVRLWVDGVLVNTFDRGSIGVVIDFNAYPMLVGRNLANEVFAQGTPNYATGIVDEVSMYGALVVDAQAERIFKTHDTIFGGLNLHYELNEGNGTVLTEGTFRVDGKALGTVSWATGYGIQERSVLVRTSTSGSADQGIGMISGKETYTTPGEVYAASAWAKAAVGETIKFSIVRNSGTTTIISYTATGVWQRLQGVFTAPADCTRVGLRVQLGNAAASVKELFVDQIALNDGSTFFPYFDLNTRNAGSNSYSFDTNLQAHTVTQTFYDYIGTWPDVATDPSYPEEINAPGSELTVRLARGAGAYGEGTDVDYNLDVRIFTVNDTYVNGTPKLIGYISDYVVNEDEGYVDVKVVSYGAEFQNYMLQTGDTREAFQPSWSVAKAPTGNWSDTWYNIEINPTKIIRLSAIKLRMAVNTNIGSPVVMKLWQGDPSINYIDVIGGSATTNTPTTNILIAAAATTPKPVSSTPGDFIFDFQDGIVLYPGKKYYCEFVFQGGTDAFNTCTYLYGGGADSLPAVAGYEPIGRVWYVKGQFNNATFFMAKDDTFPMAYMELLSSGGNTTTAVFNSADPGQILRDAMDNYQQQGGNVTYDDTSIQLTGTVVSYTFKTATILDVVKKVLELAPVGWYWYVDQATNKLVFKQQSATPDHRFLIGKHIKSLRFDKRTRDMVNVVLFTGGETSTNVNLFKKYQDAASVARYGQRIMIYSDNRVLIEATADTIAAAILSKKSYPEIRTSPEILNYDFEIVKPGQVVSFGNYEGDVKTISKWDVGQWDDMFWDFNGANPTTLELQIAQISHTPDYLSMTLSTRAIDVNKRIEDINRNLEALTTVNNPIEPINSAG